MRRKSSLWRTSVPLVTQTLGLTIGLQSVFNHYNRVQANMRTLYDEPPHMSIPGYPGPHIRTRTFSSTSARGRQI